MCGKFLLVRPRMLTPDLFAVANLLVSTSWKTASVARIFEYICVLCTSLVNKMQQYICVFFHQRVFGTSVVVRSFVVIVVVVSGRWSVIACDAAAIANMLSRVAVLSLLLPRWWYWLYRCAGAAVRRHSDPPRVCQRRRAAPTPLPTGPGPVRPGPSPLRLLGPPAACPRRAGGRISGALT